MTKLIKEHATEYYASKNFNFWYGFGVLATVVLVLQLVTGIFLTMNYKPSAADAFAFGRVHHARRRMGMADPLSALHGCVGVLHRRLSAHVPRLAVRLVQEAARARLDHRHVHLSRADGRGVLRLSAAVGQHVVLGRASHRVTVRRVPVIGNELAEWIRGDFYISDITLNRFFAFHVIAVPLMLVMLVVVHIMALHEVGSNNPDGIEIKEHKGPDGKPIDGVAFHPYHTSKDLVIIIIFLILFSAVVFFAPDMGGYFLEHANFEPADPLRTPEHIAPVWYFTPFYAILRAVPDKLARRRANGLSP